jgi:hypothetical protein
VCTGEDGKMDEVIFFLNDASNGIQSKLFISSFILVTKSTISSHDE